MLQSQDIVVLLKLLNSKPGWTFFQIASELGFSASTVHRSLERATGAGLYEAAHNEVHRAALLEFLVHGGKYVFPAVRQGEARGVPTAWAVPPLAEQLSFSKKNVPVWPDPRGSVRGIALAPIHEVVPEVARKDPRVGELLALFDAIRIGGARERDLATRALRKRLKAKGAAA